MFGRPLWMMASLAQTYAPMGRRKYSEALYMELQWRATREFVAPLFLAVAAYPQASGIKRCDSRNRRTRVAIQRIGVASRHSKPCRFGTHQGFTAFRSPKSRQTQPPLSEITKRRGH